MSDHHYIVIMAGGSGTRLWPLSRVKGLFDHGFFGHKSLKLLHH